ncbi:hypothetical protein TSUD_251010 [Trifolium subterraneum]|uniref:Uncharacterized protein n=1 Tax=Trifolium subterraneum TaxID=3900 RepID=A0A2Z6LUQ2_TRISU|nr:hypothetical protein TSUD_251010 [Trifolium subterraneum]
MKLVRGGGVASSGGLIRGSDGNWPHTSTPEENDHDLISRPQTSMVNATMLATYHPGDEHRAEEQHAPREEGFTSEPKNL